MSIQEPHSNGSQLVLSADELRIDELHRHQEDIRAQVGELRQQADDLRDRLQEAERIAAERDRLSAQVESLKQRLVEASRESSKPAVDTDKYARLLAERDRLAEDNDSLFSELDAEIAQGKALARERDELKEENERLENELASLKVELQGWLTELDSLSHQLEDARQDIHDLELLSEESMSQAERLQKFASEIEQELEEERERNAALQAQLVAVTNAPPAAAAVGGRSPDVATETVQLLREIAKAVRRPREPAPAILAELRLLRQGVQELTERQDHLKALVPTRFDPESIPRQVSPSTVAVPEGNDITALPPETGASAAEEPAASPSGERSAEDELEVQQPTEAFARVEQAWLAGLRTGDRHERSHFRSIVEKVRRRNPKMRDDTVLLQAIDSLQERFGKGFEYCLLEAALDDMHRPALNVPLLVMKMHTIKHRKNRRCH